MFGFVILALLIILGLVLILPNPRFGPGLGDEVKGFPVDEMSLTVWNWTTAHSVNVTGIAQLGTNQKYVVLSLSVRNIADHEVYFGRNDAFNEKFQKAKTKNLLLENSITYPKYGESVERAHAEASALDMGWGITLTNELTSLAPNQSVNGSLYFIIGEYYTPKKLVCTDIAHGDIFTVGLNG
jgi:hypothetical protein